jgi:hypothetical protein
MGIMRYKPKKQNIIKLKQFLSICQYQNQNQEKSKEEFIQRCIVQISSEYGKDQALAICYKKYREK